MFTLVILSAVTVMIIITFIFWGIGPRDNPTTAVLAEVAKEKVTVEEFWRTYDNEYKRIRETVGSDEEMKKLNLKERVLNSLVDRKVLLVAAQEAGITVTDKELQKEIIGTPYFQRNGVFDREVYERALKLNHLTTQAYEGMLKNDLVVLKMTRLIGETAELSPDEMKILDSMSGANQEQMLEVFRSSKSNMSVKAYIEGFKKQLDIKINSDLIS
ncbi:MAG: SurA N-terminal domain-containing protein [Nitrospirae bacterium]|nr:SurA N-terminal domain-containing protein [Nitrospirota bacterium]